MQINVAQLFKQDIGSSRSYKIDDILSFAEEEITECHIQGEVQLIRTDKGILVKGILGGTNSLVCSRCLTSFDYPLNFRIQEEFLPSKDITSDIYISLPDDSTTFVIDEHHILDLNEAVRQYALLAMPMKPLCHPHCAGICPNCGANLNHGVCHCSHGSSESHLSDLVRKGN